MKKRQRTMVLTAVAAIALGAGFAATLARAAAGAAAHGAVLTEIPELKPVQQLEDPKDILGNYRPFEVIPRTPVLEENGMFPCTNCHDNDTQQANPTVRTLEDEHESLVFVHGGGRFWCLTCHAIEARDALHSLKGQPISFDDSYLLCGQCHFQRQKDFFHGAHGKRVNSWQGERVLTNCTGCHDPHAPQIKPAKPFPPPRARTGLELDRRPLRHEIPYERIIERHAGTAEASHGATAGPGHGAGTPEPAVDGDGEPAADAAVEGAPTGAPDGVDAREESEEHP